LAEVGQRCGQNLDNIEIPSSSAAQKSKKKADKNAPPKTTNHTIPVRIFVDLAKTIAASKNPKVIVPSTISSLLGDVISLRKEVSKVLAN
jgi:hypothetical protein